MLASRLQNGLRMLLHALRQQQEQLRHLQVIPHVAHADFCDICGAPCPRHASYRHNFSSVKLSSGLQGSTTHKALLMQCLPQRPRQHRQAHLQLMDWQLASLRGKVRHYWQFCCVSHSMH